MSNTEFPVMKEDCVHRLDIDKITFTGDVTVDSMKTLTRELYQMIRELPHSRDPAQKPKLYLLIATNGGDLYAAFSAYDHILRLRKQVDIITVADGFVASAGTLLLMAGKQRMAMPNSGLLFHQLSSGFNGTYKDMMDQVDACKWLMKRLTRVYHKNSNMTRKQVSKLLKSEKTLTVKKCMNMGFVHEYY